MPLDAKTLGQESVCGGRLFGALADTTNLSLTVQKHSFAPQSR